VKSAWRRARERAGVKDAWFRDLRPKALSDAKRQGLSLEKVRDAAGHTSVATTEDYMRGFELKKANLQLTLPKLKRSV
jgi:integrase